MKNINRRRFLQNGVGALGLSLGGTFLGGRIARAAAALPAVRGYGLVIGEPTATRVGNEMLASGGNVVDAIVTAALAAAVVSLHNCGIGGYGGHMMLALNGGKKFRSIDFNTAAPAAARSDMFPLDANLAVQGRINTDGWLAAGVPGTLAGLDLARKRYGTRSFREVVAPALKLAKDGFPLSEALARGIRTSAAKLRNDPGSARLLLGNSAEPKAGELFRNPDLAQLLETLSSRNSADSFYRGDIGRRIAEAFQQNGGLVTVKDMADYRARVVKPVEFEWRGFTIATAPLTSGGLSVLQAFAVLKALKWDAWPETPAKAHARLETLRLVWQDRLDLFGDPAKVKVPVERLLSRAYASELAARVETAVKDRKPLSLNIQPRPQDGTIHLSAVDQQGNMAALTLTHGNLFGARVTVDGLGLTLGHGMSRFDPRPDHPNAPGPGKRPLHNMCPTILRRDGRAVLALGGRGGRKIPNSVFDVLTHYVSQDASIENAVAAPRLHTEGDLKLTLEKEWPAAEAEFLKTIGYTVQTGPGAVVSAVTFEPKTGESRAAER